MVKNNKDFLQTEFIDEDGMLTAEEKNQLLYKLDPKAVEPVKKAKDYTIYEALNFFLN